MRVILGPEQRGQRLAWGGDDLAVSCGWGPCCAPGSRNQRSSNWIRLRAWRPPRVHAAIGLRPSRERSTGQLYIGKGWPRLGAHTGLEEVGRNERGQKVQGHEEGRWAYAVRKRVNPALQPCGPSGCGLCAIQEWLKSKLRVMKRTAPKLHISDPLSPPALCCPRAL